MATGMPVVSPGSQSSLDAGPVSDPKPIIVTPPSPADVINSLRPGIHVNIPLLVGTVVLLVVMAGGGWFVRGYFLHANSAVYLEKARRAEAQGEVDAALGFYRQYLEFRQNAGRTSDAERLQRAEVLGQVIGLLHSRPEDVVTIRELYRTYEECLMLNRAQPERRRRFVALLLQMPRFRDALDHLKVWGETAQPGRESGEVAYLSGICLEAEGKHAESQREFLKSIRDWPDQTVAYVRLAQLWTEHPDKIAPLSEDDVPPGPEWQRAMEIVRPAEKEQPVPAPQAAEAVLEAMFASHVGLDGVIEAARFLISQQNATDRLPSTSVDAELQVRGALSSEHMEPADGTGESPRQPLEFLDRWSLPAPAFSDADGDGRVTPEELRRRFERGDALSRIDWAERRLKNAIAGAERAQLVELQLALVSLYTTKAEVARFQEPEDVAESLKMARESLSAAVGGGEGDIRFLLARLALDLEDLQGSTEEQGRLTRLRTAQQQLSTVLNFLVELGGTGNSTATDDWTIGSRMPDVRLLKIELRFDLAGLLLSECALVGPADRAGLRDRVRGEVESLRQLGARSQFIEYIRLRELMVEEEYAKGREWAATLQGKLTVGSSLSRQVALLAAECEERMGNSDARLNLFRQHLKDDPLWIPGRQGLAESLLALGRLDDAIEQYRPLAGLPAIGTRLLELLLVRNSGVAPRQRDWKDADALLTFLQERSLETVRIALLGVELRVLQAGTLNGLAQETSNPDQEREALHRLSQAEQLLDAVGQSHPQEVSVRAAQVGLSLRRFDRTPAERLLQSESILLAARQEFGRKVELDLLEATIAIERSAKDGLDCLQALAESSTELSLDDQYQLAAGLARLAAQAGDLQTSAKLWQQAARLLPEDIEARLAIARLLLSQEKIDDDEWETTLTEIARIERTDLGSVAWLRAERILRGTNDAADRREQLATAKRLLKSAERTRPYWSAIPRALGLLEELQGQREAAIESYERALSLGDRSPEVIRRVVLHYYSRQQFSEADRLLQQMVNENANLVTGDLARLAWRVSWNRQQYDQALGVVRKLTESSRSAEDHIALALMQFVQGGQNAEIEELLRKAAYELSPEEAESWSALVGYLARTGQWEKAETAIADARQRLPNMPQPTALLVTGSLFELLAARGAPRQQDYAAEATRAFEQALGAAGEDNAVLTLVADHYIRTESPGRADPLLQLLLNPTRNVPAEVRLWARRRLAQVVASGGSYEDTRRALALLRAVTASGEDRTPANLRLQLQLLDRLVGQETRAERVDVLRGLQAQSALTLEEHLQLADLLQEGGDAAGARSEYRTLLDAAPRFTRARAAFIISLASESGTDEEATQEAVRQLQLLKEFEPRSWQTTLVTVRLLMLTGKPADAVAVLDAFLKNRVDEGLENPVREILEQENLPLFLSQFQRDRRVRASPSILAAVMESGRQLQAGKREEAIQALLQGAAAALLAELQYDVILKAGLLCEELNLPDAERFFGQYLARSPRADAPLALAAYLVRQDRVTEALAVCDAHWDRLPKLGVGTLILLAVRQVPSEQRAVLNPWRDRLAAELDKADAFERGILSVQLADLERHLGTPDLAIAGYRRAVAANPRDALALNNLAALLARHSTDPEELEEAQRSVSEAVRIAGSVPDLLDTQAMVYLAQGQPAVALALLQPLATPQARPGVHLRIAECLLRLNRQPEARRSLEAARRKGFSLESVPPPDRPRVEDLLREIETDPAR